MMAAAAAAARARIAAPAEASAHSSLVFDATTSASEALCSGLDSPLGFVDESSLMKNTTFIRANSQRTQYKNVPTLDSLNFFFNRPARLRRLLRTVGARVDSLGGYITPLRVHRSRFRGRYIIPLAPDAPTPVEPRRLAEGFHPLQRPAHKTHLPVSLIAHTRITK